MQDIVYKSTIGTGGFIATIELGHINELLGLVVGLATLVYMTASAVKVIKELKDKLYEPRTTGNARRRRERLCNETDRSSGRISST